jgi:hypothetical protein
MKHNGMEWNGTEWNRYSVMMFGYFIMELNNVFIPLFGK